MRGKTPRWSERNASLHTPRHGSKFVKRPYALESHTLQLMGPAVIHTY